MYASACVDSRVTGTKEMEGVAERKKLRGMEIEMRTSMRAGEVRIFIIDLIPWSAYIVPAHSSHSPHPITSPHVMFQMQGPLPPVRSQRRKRRRWL